MSEKNTAANSPKATPVLVMPTKSMAVAILLTLFFGPLGLFYSSVKGGIIMLILSMVVGLLTAGFGLIVTQIMCVIWGAVSTNAHNQKMVTAVSGNE